MIENLPGEVWRDIEDYPDYEISNKGRVKIKPKEAKIMSPGKNISKSSGTYLLYRLFNSEGSKHKKAHRLVAQAFIPNPENKEQVNHIDNNPSNNSVENLEWNTRSENALHMHRQGRGRGRAKLTPDDVKYMRFLKGKMTNKELGEIFGVAHSTANSILTKQSYIHIH